MTGFVVAESDVESSRASGDTAAVRLMIDASSGCERLEQRILRFARGRSQPREEGERQAVLYVVSGRGSLRVDGAAHELEPDMGVYIAPGERYEVENPGPDEVVLVAVSAPLDAPGSRRVQRTVRLADRPVLPAGADREFRYLMHADLGCTEITQFVGVIPPGRAPMHSHTYDEVVYVIEGGGVLHLDRRQTPIAAGSCMHLPPLVEHCLENTGEAPMRVLGVFHPSGDPASRAYEANE
jgi:mannose-6-phosphate isomerase-like protein (cupin superfamily)